MSSIAFDSIRCVPRLFVGLFVEIYTRAVPKVRGHDLIMRFLEYYSNKHFI